MENAEYINDNEPRRAAAAKTAKKHFPVLAILFCALLIAADQFSKFLAVRFLKPVDSVPLIRGFINLTFVENDGVAFGMFRGGRWVFVVLSAVVAAAIAIYYTKIPAGKRLLRLSAAIIFSGAVGNLINRALTGLVVDFFCFEFINFPVFNIADCLIVTGTILFAALLIFDKKTWKN